MINLDESQCGLNIVVPADDESPAQSAVVINNIESADLICGAVLESCLSFKDLFVVFTVNGDCFEDSLWISLFDASLNLKESVDLTWPYSGGVFRLIQFDSQDAIVFEYFGRRYFLRIFEKSHFRIPFLSDVAEVWKGFRFHTYLEVKPLKGVVA